MHTHTLYLASASCTSLPNVDDATIIYTMEASAGSGFPEGTRGVYECIIGELFNGDAVRVCLSSGYWSGQEPICSGQYIL